MTKHIDDHNNLNDKELLRLKIDILNAKLAQVRKERADAKKELKRLVRRYPD
jgi:hypothetical protein